MLRYSFIDFIDKSSFFQKIYKVYETYTQQKHSKNIDQKGANLHGRNEFIYAEERANISDTADRKMASFAIKCKGASFPYIVPVNDLILWSTRAVRADKDHRDKDQVFAGASGIARLYEETADNITAEAEKYYIKVSD